MILCIAEDTDLLLMISAWLESSGYKVETAADWESARALNSDPKLALYLLIQNEPTEKELDLCRRLRTLDARTPILFYSLQAPDPMLEAALSAGAQGFIVAPSSLADLVETISRLIK